MILGDLGVIDSERKGFWKKKERWGWCEECHDGAGSDEATTTPGEKEEGLRKVLERAYGCIEKTRRGRAWVSGNDK